MALVRIVLLALLAFVSAANHAWAERDIRSTTSDNKGVLSASPSATRTQTTARGAGGYFIEFRSRYAYTYGHSYVVFGRVNAAGKMIDPEVAGLAPKSDDPAVYMLGHVTPVPASTGWTDGDLEDEYRSASWRVMLSEAEYRNVVGYIRKLQAKSTLWHASLYNCNSFVADIARYMGYRAPGHLLRPQQFITKLREMNGGTGYTAPTAEPSTSAIN